MYYEFMIRYREITSMYGWMYLFMCSFVQFEAVQYLFYVW